ncbi:MAG: hypothetical protein ACC707_20775, partial [Thiohalomonadales bacterium]
MNWNHIGLGVVLFTLYIAQGNASTQKIQENVTHTEMTQKQMETIITDMAEMSQGRDGLVKFKYHGIPMAVISDVKHNRMRIISPIKTYTEVSSKQIDSMMEANFHTALDARYAV